MARQPLFHSTSAVAAFDVGSNTARAILARTRGDGVLLVVAADQRMTALGRGLSESGCLDAAGLAATVEFVKSVLDAWGRPDQVFLAATEAARAAANADELVRRLRDEAQVRAEIIDGEEEARLAWRGALSINQELAALNPAVVDIGGRSTEIVLERDGELHAESRPIGARWLAEAMAAGESADLLERIHESLLSGLWQAQIASSAANCGAVVCTGGTAQTAVRLLGKRHISHDEIISLERELAALSPEERRRRLSFDPERADIICPGLLIMGVVAASAPRREVIVSEGGVREGLLLDRTGATRLEWW